MNIDLRSYRGTFSVQEFVDKAFAFLESILAVNWTIGNGLERCGIVIPLPVGAASYMGLTQAGMAGLWLSHSKGFDAVVSEQRGGMWRIEADFAVSETFTTALTFATLADPDCDVVALSCSGSTAAPVTVTLADYLRYAELAPTAEGPAAALSLIDLLHHTSQSGSCLLSASDLEFAIVCLGIAIVEGDLSQIPHLRRARQLADRHGFAEVARLAADSIASARFGVNSALKLELANRTRSLRVPTLPSAEVVNVVLSSPTPARHLTCD